MQIAAIGLALLLVGIVGVSLWRLQTRVRAIRHAVIDRSASHRRRERRPATDSTANGPDASRDSSYEWTAGRRPGFADRGRFFRTWIDQNRCGLESNAPPRHRL